MKFAFCLDIIDPPTIPIKVYKVVQNSELCRASCNHLDLFNLVQLQGAVLECTATGSPPPRIEWRRADNAVLPTGGVVYRGHR